MGILESWNTLGLILYNLILKQFPWDKAAVRQDVSCSSEMKREYEKKMSYNQKLTLDLASTIKHALIL